MTHRPILLITNRYPTRDKPFAGKFVERHARLHREMGYAVEVLSTGDSRTGKLRSVVKYARLSWNVAKRALFGKVALIHAHWPFPAGLFGLLVSKTRRVPLLLTSHGAFVDDFEQQPKAAKWLVGLVLRNADFIVCVGEANRENVLRIANVPREKTAVCPMGLWLEYTPPLQTEARHQLRLPLTQFIIIFVGNFNHPKGVDLLIDALALLEPEVDFHCYFGGQGPLERKMQQCLDELDLTQRCTILGTIAPDDVPIWLAAADLCVVPSRREAFGLVAVEAMAVETAVVATRVGGLTQTITHQHNGWLVSPENPSQLAEAIHYLAQHPEIRSQLGKNGKIAAQQYDMRRAANQVSEIYKSLIKQHSA